MTDLTFAIPYYSGRHYLERAIRSVLSQEDEHWRLVVCDGRGREPDLETFLASFGDRRIRYVAWDGVAGMAANWNRCLDSADTDLVTLLHGDDELLKGYGDLMRTAAVGQPQAAAFFCPARIIDAEGAECFSFPDYVKRWLIPGSGGQVVLQGEAGLRALLWGNFIMCPTLCYRKPRLAGRRFALGWHRFPTWSSRRGCCWRGKPWWACRKPSTPTGATRPTRQRSRPTVSFVSAKRWRYSNSYVSGLRRWAGSEPRFRRRSSSSSN